MAGNLLMGISQDERERAVFRSRRMYQTDQQSNLATAEDRGRAKGRAEGRVEQLKKTIIAFSKTNSPEQMAEALNIPLEQVLSILAEGGCPDT